MLALFRTALLHYTRWLSTKVGCIWVHHRWFLNLGYYQVKLANVLNKILQWTSYNYTKFTADITIYIFLLQLGGRIRSCCSTYPYIHQVCSLISKLNNTKRCQWFHKFNIFCFLVFCYRWLKTPPGSSLYIQRNALLCLYSIQNYFGVHLLKEGMQWTLQFALGYIAS